MPAGRSGALKEAFCRFSTAHTLAMALEASGFPPADLPVPPVLTDEACACTMSGIGACAEFLVSNPADYVFHRLGPEGLADKAVRRRIRDMSSETRPVFPGRFAEILWHAHRSRAPDHAQARDGVEALLKLRGQLDPIEYAFEEAWIDHALLQGWRHLGNDLETEAVARRIAAQMIVRKSLAPSAPS